MAIMRTGRADIDRDPAELRATVASMYPEVDEKYWPSVELIARVLEFDRAVRSAWGTWCGTEHRHTVGLRVDAPVRTGGERMCASPGMARASLSSDIPDRRAGDPADDHRAHPGDPMPATTPSLGCRPAATSPTTSPARGTSRSTAWTPCPGSSSPTGS